VNWKVYALYARKVGIPLAIIYAVVLFLCTGGIEIGSSFWLANGRDDRNASSSSQQQQSHYSTSVRLIVYSAFGVAQGTTVVARTIDGQHHFAAIFLGITSFLLAMTAYSASTQLHGAMVHNRCDRDVVFRYDTVGTNYESCQQGIR